MSIEATRRSVIAGGLAIAAGSLPHLDRALAGSSAAVAQNQRTQDQSTRPAGGINLAGADFGKIPGTHGREYLYPARKHVDYYRALGFTLIRLPFKWERLQPELNQAFASAEAARLTDLTRYATSAGTQVILDPHNYAKRRIAGDGWSTEHRIGSNAVPAASFFDFWSRLAALFRDDQRVVFGLMNEPVGIAAAPWLDIVNGTIAAIRNTGASNLILVPGVDYTGAHSWFRVGNTAMAGVVDPARHFAFDVHQYFDGNSSGTKPEAVSGTIGSERIEAFQDWAREHGFKAILGEFNGGRNPTSYNALHDLCQEMAANPDVWLGWAAWAGGPRWPEKEMFNLEPWSDGRVREQTQLLAQYARPQSPDFWVAPGSVIDLDFARNRLFGTESFAAALALTRADAPKRTESPGTEGLRAAADIPRTRKGLRFGAREIGASSGDPGLASGAVALGGPLLALLQAPAFTLVMQVRALSPKPKECAFLSTDSSALLQRSADGALECMLGARLRTASQPLENWRANRRIAVAVQRDTGRLAIATTGAGAAETVAALPHLDRIAIGGAGTTSLDGYITRITGYRKFLDPGALQTLLA